MRHHLGETWIDPEDMAYNTYSGAPSGSNRRGLVRFSDGKLRIVRLGVPDTYFSIPAKPSRGRVGQVTQTCDVWDIRESDSITKHARAGEEYIFTSPD